MTMQSDERAGETYDQAIARIDSYDEAVQIGIELLADESDSNWCLGDLAARVVQLNDEKDGAFLPAEDVRTEEPDLERREVSLRQFARAIRIGYGRLKEAVRVARAVEPGIRETFRGLYWTHWRAMVRGDLEGPALVEWAQRAEDDEWSAERLHEELKDARATGGAGGGPGGPAPPPEPWQSLDKSLTNAAVEMRRATSDDKALARLVKEAPETARELILAAEALIERVERIWAEVRAAGERLRFAAGPARKPLQTAVPIDERPGETAAEAVAATS